MIISNVACRPLISKVSFLILNLQSGVKCQVASGPPGLVHHRGAIGPSLTLPARTRTFRVDGPLPVHHQPAGALVGTIPADKRPTGGLAVDAEVAEDRAEEMAAANGSSARTSALKERSINIDKLNQTLRLIRFSAFRWKRTRLPDSFHRL